jgi:serine/threonine protein kinase
MSDTLASILNREPPALSSYGVAAPDELRHILAKALAKHRDERYQSIKDMELDLIQLRKDVESGTARSSQKESASTETRTFESESRKQRTGMPRGQRRSLFLTVGILSAALLTWAVMANRSTVATAPQASVPPSTPVTPVADRQLTYSLLVQKTSKSKPYHDSGQAILENGAKVKFDFSVPQSGSLYLLNDGPGPDGKQELNLEFPTPSVNNGSAQVMAFKSVQTGPLVMDNHPGREKFWIVWSTRPLPDLEQAIQQVAKSGDPAIFGQQSQAIRTLLATATKARINVDHDNKQTSLSGHGDVLVGQLELEHR